MTTEELILRWAAKQVNVPYVDGMTIEWDYDTGDGCDTCGSFPEVGFLLRSPDGSKLYRSWGLYSFSDMMASIIGFDAEVSA